MARTDTLPHFLTDVADAIRTKTGSSDTIQASNFDTEIENIPSGGGSRVRPKSISYNSSTSLQQMDFSLLDDSDLTSLSMCFYQCENLTTLQNEDSLHCNNVSNFSYMFAFDHITSVNLENLNPSNVTRRIDCSSMFYNCESLTTINLQNFEVSNLKGETMFFDCTSLTHLDIRKMDLTNLTSYNEMFGGREYKIPANCEIIVKDTANKTWIETNFDWLTNVKTVAEYEAENQ